MHEHKFLSSIATPADLRKLPESDLPFLCRELRDFIVSMVSKHGGHFGASMGVIELTVAIHFVFNTPNDLLVWDVGHQAYGHKILTGRKDAFITNRKYKGISGFPRRDESEYDTFGVGHSSTSISAALGMAVASRLNNLSDRQTIAVIGDGALTAGLAFEGLNNAGVSNTNLLVILNDNCMSIDPNVGAMKEYLTDITTSPAYNRMRGEVWNLLGKFNRFGPAAREIARKIEGTIKHSLIQQSNLFESLRFRYFGPTDGHDVIHLVHILRDLKNIPGPKVLHCLTVKGKGYEPAEKGDKTFWHSPGLFAKETGELIKPKINLPQPPKYQDVFGKTLLELARLNPKIVGITPAMPTGCSMDVMLRAIPERTFDVGIAEQHAVTFSAGLATQGIIPFCNIYSTFMQRAYDQVIHDVCIQNLKVIFCLDRAGVAGSDGATHHGNFDLAYMRCLPNMIVSSPMNEEELRNLMYTAQLDEIEQPFCIRYPRGSGVMTDWEKPFRRIEVGKGRKIRDGRDIAILTIGHIGNYAVQACAKLEGDGISAAHFDMRFVKPLDSGLLHEIFRKFDHILTVEDGCLMGGFGSAALEFMAENNYHSVVKRLGIPDRVIHHGEQSELQRECGYDPDGIYAAVKELLTGKDTSKMQENAKALV
ncbi:MAG: 1-deoxy-D-xylulose-5-phosphate synthase [Bacteroidetes bacterium]|nr:1-deoxy-D-xylulose-5-phosphate synthase [Bacteroidota bacterium]